MAEFMRPTVTTEEVNDTVARFIVEPLERGFGYTLGNCMRRVLLSSLDGAKATAIQIEGVQHEFTTAEGVIEDVTDIVLNVKGLVFSALSEDYTEATATISVEGPCTVTGADVKVPAEFTLINPEHVICTVADGGTLNMSIRIGVGRGYVSAERNKRTEDPIGIIHVDSLFSPVRRCTLPSFRWLILSTRKRARFRPSSHRRARRPTPSSTSRLRIWTFPSALTTA